MTAPTTPVFHSHLDVTQHLHDYNQVPADQKKQLDDHRIPDRNDVDLWHRACQAADETGCPDRHAFRNWFFQRHGGHYAQQDMDGRTVSSVV